MFFKKIIFKYIFCSFNIKRISHQWKWRDYKFENIISKSKRHLRPESKNYVLIKNSYWFQLFHMAHKIQFFKVHYIVFFLLSLGYLLFFFLFFFVLNHCNNFDCLLCSLYFLIDFNFIFVMGQCAIIWQYDEMNYYVLIPKDLLKASICTFIDIINHFPFLNQ